MMGLGKIVNKQGCLGAAGGLSRTLYCPTYGTAARGGWFILRGSAGKEVMEENFTASTAG